MKFSSKVKAGIVMSALVSSAGHALPVDLNDLVKRWDAIEKKDESLAQRIRPTELTLTGAFPIDQLLASELAAALERGIDISGGISLVRLEEEKSRKDLLTSLFVSGNRDLAFCNLFPDKEFKPRKGDDLSETERLEKQLQTQFNFCRKQMGEILGGALHSNPTIYVFQAQGANSNPTQVIAFVRSIADQTKYLRYAFEM